MTKGLPFSPEKGGPHFSSQQPLSDEGGGPLAVEGGKKCSLYLFLPLDYSMVYCSDLNFII